MKQVFRKLKLFVTLILLSCSLTACSSPGWDAVSQDFKIGKANDGTEYVVSWYPLDENIQVPTPEQMQKAKDDQALCVKEQGTFEDGMKAVSKAAIIGNCMGLKGWRAVVESIIVMK